MMPMRGDVLKRTERSMRGEKEEIKESNKSSEATKPGKVGRQIKRGRKESPNSEAGRKYWHGSTKTAEREQKDTRSADG